MPAEFDNFGVRFQYPENWSLDVEEGAEECSISIASPVGAFWTLSIHPPGSDLATLTRTVLGVLQGEFSDLDFETVSDRLDDQPLTGYDVHFYCLDFINTAAVRAFQTSRAAYVLLYQAEDRDYERFEPIFRAITTSFLRNQADDVL